MATADQLYDQAADAKDRGDRDEAVRILQQAVEAEPDHAESHGMLAKLCADSRDFEAAVRHAKRVVEINPDDVFSYTALSVIYQRCGMIPEAEHAKAIAYRKEHGFED